MKLKFKAVALLVISGVAMSLVLCDIKAVLAAQEHACCEKKAATEPVLPSQSNCCITNAERPVHTALVTADSTHFVTLLPETSIVLTAPDFVRVSRINPHSFFTSLILNHTYSAHSPPVF